MYHEPDPYVEIMDFDVPSYPISGQDVMLHCRFQLRGSKYRLYTVNWWRGKDQFYTYKERDSDPKTFRKFPGIRVKVIICKLG